MCALDCRLSSDGQQQAASVHVGCGPQAEQAAGLGRLRPEVTRERAKQAVFLVFWTGPRKEQAEFSFVFHFPEACFVCFLSNFRQISSSFLPIQNYPTKILFSKQKSERNAYEV